MIIHKSGNINLNSWLHITHRYGFSNKGLVELYDIQLY